MAHVVLGHSPGREALLERPRELCACQALAMRLMARIASSSLSTTKPLTPSSIISGTDPRPNAITGVPQAMASIITKPKGSGQSIGNSSAAAPRSRSSLASVVEFAHELDLLAIDDRLQTLLVVSGLGPRDFSRHPQGHTRCTRQADCDLRTLFAGQPAKKREICSGLVARLQAVGGHAMIDGAQPVC